MLVWRERRKNLWSSRSYTRTFIQVVGEVGFSPPALRRTSWTQQKKKKKSSYTFNLPPFRNMKNSRQKSEVTCPWSCSKSMTPNLLVSGSCCHYQWEKKNPWGVPHGSESPAVQGGFSLFLRNAYPSRFWCVGMALAVWRLSQRAALSFPQHAIGARFELVSYKVSLTQQCWKPLPLTWAPKFPQGGRVSELRALQPPLPGPE